MAATFAIGPARSMRRVALLLLLPLVSGAACASRRVQPLEGFAADVEIRFADRVTVARRLDPVPHSNRDRAERLRELFRQAGCADGLLRDRFDGHSELPNIVCALPGRSDEIIIVAAQYDRPRYGAGIVDNWSGVAMLPALYRALQHRTRRHTYLFIGFTDGTRKMRIGSRYFAQRMAESGEIERVRAMINLKGLGLSEPAVWTDRSDPDLLLDLSSVGEALGQRIRDVNFRRVENAILLTRRREFGFIADAESFRLFGVPTLTIHSLGVKTARLVRDSRNDVDPSLIDPQHYYATYRLVAVYLGYLDDSLEARRSSGNATRFPSMQVSALRALQRS